jgi:hypothetical protein
VIVEVESSENCEAGVFARFKEAGAAKPVIQVRLYERNAAGEWYWVGRTTPRRLPAPRTRS